MNNYQLTIINEKNLIAFYSSLFLFDVVFDIEISKRRSSLQSIIILLYSVEVIKFVSFNKSSQYSVSAHSLRDILTFTKNSFRLTEYWASLKFAPMEVPERNNCFASTNSRFSSQRYLYKLYTLMANLRLFSRTILFIYIKNKYKAQKRQEKKRVSNEIL